MPKSDTPRQVTMEELSKLIDEGHPVVLEALKEVFKAVKKVAKEDYGVKDEEIEEVMAPVEEAMARILSDSLYRSSSINVCLTSLSLRQLRKK